MSTSERLGERVSGQAGAPSEADRDTAGEVWRLMSEYAVTQFRRKSHRLQETGLSPGHMKALLALEPGKARPMGACAQDLGCDASTATWLVDRLEEKGLVERRPSRKDRRVKGVLLTAEGTRTRALVREHYGEPPAALARLSASELDDLKRLLTRLAEISDDLGEGHDCSHPFPPVATLGR